MSDETDTATDSKRISAKAVDARVDDLSGKLDRVVESTNVAFDKLSEQIARMSDAINRPVTRTHALDAAAQDMGPNFTAEFNDEGVLEKPTLLDVATPEFKQKADNLAFANEMIEIEIQEVSDRNADKVFEVAVNGRKMIFQRGYRYQVPRYIVEGLARARPVHFDNQEYVDGDGVRKVRNPSRRGLRYPFSVTQDSDRGRAWLKNLLATA
jgi:hypothetical protein